jgi:hypothetical protein
MSNIELKRRLRLASIAILVVGLFCATLIYQFAGDSVDDSLGYSTVNGKVYALSTRDSKMYRHNIELYGGKMALLFDDFYHWFLDLWKGKALAKTIAWISVLVSLAIYAFAGSLPDSVPDGREEPERSKPD